MNKNIQQSLNLKDLINNNEYENNTEYIRKLKHSDLIYKDIMTLQLRKSENSALMKSDPTAFSEFCKAECTFLYNNYTDIYNKVFKDELDLSIMQQLLVVLKQIEDEKVDQYQGSVLVGEILKKMYIDSAMKRGNSIESSIQTEPEKKCIDGKSVSWKQYKRMVK
jgi:hypothetical protein